MIPKCEEYNDRLKEAASVTKKKENDNDILPLNFSGRSQLSTVSSMSESPAPNFVYVRRKQQGNSSCNFPTQTYAKAKRAVDCPSVVSSSAPSLAVEEQPVDSLNELQTLAVGVAVMPPPVCNVEPNDLKSETINGFSFVERGSDESAKSVLQKIVDVDSANDSCSSSKSAMELVEDSMNTKADDGGECSSSSVTFNEVCAEGMSARDLCIAVLRSQGFLRAVKSTRTHASADGLVGSSDSSCSRSCKMCGNSGTTLKLLICDTCEEAYHLSCCKPPIKEIPEDDEWFCQLCLKNKSMKETISRKFSNIIRGGDRNKNAWDEDESNPIALMLKETDPYRTSVRVGKGFQAEVPEWLGPSNNGIDAFDELLLTGPSNYSSSPELNTDKCLKKGPIGNWLQCREVIYGVAEEGNEVICGKWRRAPLFEVQTDNWECFCAFLWDPIHADCAVPQELETDEVLKQLKYVETVRHRLAAKRRKLNRANRGSSVDAGGDARTGR
ncbi:hypothetical protein HS088_TW09G00963 [Tripterygium wilfordii]|uniref:Uncharacterized protein n=2 Tax=Tripterygium wilfordii TaxID=458696 RepID=A0A7J7D9B4_TRIWF|nr:uncharacterized protein LOC120004742 isoform X2 [Tripterygium wilfordii]KAF5742901.1 hypothetical protein HS088_TW09G00963 [Tripterygium wilfordii]